MFSSATARISNFFGLSDGGDDFETAPLTDRSREVNPNSSNNVNRSYFQPESRADTTNTYRPVSAPENTYRQPESTPAKTEPVYNQTPSVEMENTYRTATEPVAQPSYTRQSTPVATAEVENTYQSNRYFEPADIEQPVAKQTPLKGGLFGSNSRENVRVSPKVVPMNTNESTLQKNTVVEKPVKKIAILEPRTYTESKNIAKCIFRNEIVIVNFHLVEESQARRIVDFLTGAVYALDGDIQRLGGEIFICTPPNTEIDSATAKSLLSSQFSDF